MQDDTKVLLEVHRRLSAKFTAQDAQEVCRVRRCMRLQQRTQRRKAVIYTQSHRVQPAGLLDGDPFLFLTRKWRHVLVWQA